MSLSPIRLPRSAALAVARLLLTLAGWGLALPALAWSIGSARAPVVIGQPLDLGLPVQVAAGVALTPDCVRVEASFGEQRLPRGQLSVVVEPAADPTRALLRVRSVQAVEEPVVTLTVGLGCPARLSREFVLFAELPVFAAAPPTAAPRTAATGEPPARAEAAPVAAAAAGPPLLPPAAADGPGAAAAAAAPPVAAPRVAQAAARADAAAPRPAARAAARARAAAAPQARLRLELLPPAAASPPAAQQDPALQAATARAEAAERALLAAQAAAEQAGQRVSELEAALTRQTADAQAQHAAILAMQRDLAGLRAQSAWWPLLAGLLGAAGLLMAVAAWWRARPPAASSWWPPAPATAAEAEVKAEVHAAAPAAGPPPEVDRTLPLPAELQPPERFATGPPGVAAPLAPPALPDPQASAATPVERAAGAEGLAASPQAPPTPEDNLLAMTDDEQIDLEQQVDFLCVLGQDDTAAGLLRERLRDSAGRAPLPQLRLFELYRRLGDRAAYERLAARFADRFHATVPGWDEPAPAASPALEEDHPVLAQLQRCWGEPPAARRMLAALLQRGQAAVAPWSLAAFDDLLLLYRITGEPPEPPPSPVTLGLELSPVEPVSAVAAAPPRKARRKAETVGGRRREPRRDRELAPDFAEEGSSTP